MKIYLVIQNYDGEVTTEVFTDADLATKATHDHHQPDFESLFPDREFPECGAEGTHELMQEFFKERDSEGGTWNYVTLEVHDLPEDEPLITPTLISEIRGRVGEELADICDQYGIVMPEHDENVMFECAMDSMAISFGHTVNRFGKRK